MVLTTVDIEQAQIDRPDELGVEPARVGREASILTSILSVAAFDFLFVTPIYNFAMADAQYLVTFFIMLPD